MLNTCGSGLVCTITVGNGVIDVLPDCLDFHVRVNSDLFTCCILSTVDLPCLELLTDRCREATCRQGVLRVHNNGSRSHRASTTVGYEAHGVLIVLPDCLNFHIGSNSNLCTNCILSSTDLPCLELLAGRCREAARRQGVLGVLIDDNIGHRSGTAISVKAYGGLLSVANCVGGEVHRVNGDHTITDNNLLSVTISLFCQRLNIAATTMSGMVTVHLEAISITSFEGDNNRQKTGSLINRLLIMDNVIDHRGLFDLNFHKDQLFTLLFCLFLDCVLYYIDNLVRRLCFDRHIHINFDRLIVVLRITLQFFHNLISNLFQTANHDIRSIGLNFNHRIDILFRHHDSFDGNALLNLNQNRHRLSIMHNHKIVGTILHIYKDVVAVNIGGGRGYDFASLAQCHSSSANTDSVSILNLTGYGNGLIGHLRLEGQFHRHACILAIEVHLAIRNQAKVPHIVVDTTEGESYHLDLVVIAFPILICLILPNRICSGVSNRTILADDSNTLNTKVAFLLRDDLILLKFGIGLNCIQDLYIDGSGDIVARNARVKRNAPCCVEAFGTIGQNGIEHGDIDTIIADRFMFVIHSSNLDSICTDNAIFGVLRAVAEGIACLRMVAFYLQVNHLRINDLTVTQQCHAHLGSTLVHILCTGLDRTIAQRIRVAVIDAQVTLDLDRGDQGLIEGQLHDFAGRAFFVVIEHFAVKDVALLSQIHIDTVQHIANDLELMVIAAAHISLILPDRITAGIGDRIAIGNLDTLSTVADSLLGNNTVVLQCSVLLCSIQHLHIDGVGNNRLTIPIDRDLPLCVEALGTVVQGNSAIAAAGHSVIMVLRLAVIAQCDSLNGVCVTITILVGLRHIQEHIGSACSIAGHHSSHNDGIARRNTVSQKGNKNLGRTLACILRTALHTTVRQGVGVGIVKAHTAGQIDLFNLFPNRIQGRVAGQAGISTGIIFSRLSIGSCCPTTEDIALTEGFLVGQTLIFAAQSLRCGRTRTAVCVISNVNLRSGILHRLIVLVRIGDRSQIELTARGQVVEDQFAVNGVTACNQASISSLQGISVCCVQTGEGQRVTVRHANDISFHSGLGINGHTGIDGGGNFLGSGIILIDLIILVLSSSHDLVGSRLLQTADDDITAGTLNPTIHRS